MKRLTFAASFATLLLLASSCSEKKSNTSTDASDQTTLSQTDPNNEIIAERDSLIALFNDISGDLVQIRQVESIVSVPTNLSGEAGSTVPKLRDDISAISQTLQLRRQRLDELEARLKASSNQNADLLAMIDNLKLQMTQNEETIASLTEQLATANTTIAGLNTKVDSLNTTVAQVNAEKDDAQQQNVRLTNELNKVYYVIGSKKELKEHKIIETGFLRKTKVMPADFEASYFTTADRRTLTTLPLDSRKAKVLTSQPSDSYTIVTNANGTKSIQITNPAKFWGTTNYLVIQID